MSANPVFNRIDKEAGGYAGFGRGSQQHPGQMPPPQGRPRHPGMPAGAQNPSATMSDQQLQDLYSQPAAGPGQTGRLTVDDVVMKALGLFAIVLGVAAAVWFFVGPLTGLTTTLWLVGMFGSLGLGMLIAFKKEVSVPLILTHAVLQGLFVGAISATFAAAYDGVVTTAVVSTMGTLAGMFFAWKTGFIKVTSKSRRIFGLMVWGYLIFALVNIGASFMGFGDGWGIYGGPLGIIVSLFGVGMASYSLAVDFDSIDRGVKAGAPEQYSWLMGHGLVASLVWLYIEFLRLFAILANND
jgi:uncharacterized YccA/Bax inhibitor family protein